MRFSLAGLAAAALLAGCAGTIPRRDYGPDSGLSAVILGGKIILPAGESREGSIAINLEGDGGRQASTYRLPLEVGRAKLFLIEPGDYRLLPTRSIFGFRRDSISVELEGRTLSVPFSREILRRPAMTIRSKKAHSLGVLVIKINTALPGQPASITASLDDGPAARRSAVQEIIREMMDPNSTVEERETAILWAKPLDDILSAIMAEPERRPTFKPSP